MIELTESEKKSTLLKFFLCLVIIFLLSQYVYSMGTLFLKGEFTDFKFFLISSKTLQNLQEKEAPAYREMVKIQGGMSIYHPLPVYIILRPLTLFKYRHAVIFWLILNQIIFFFSIYFCLRGVRKKISLTELSALVFMAFSFFPVFFTFESGNVNVFTLFFLAAAFYSFKKEKEILSGFLLSMAILIKFLPALLILFFLLKRKFKLVIATLAGLLIAFSFSIWYLGLPMHIMQIKVLYEATPRLVVKLCNTSLSAFFFRLFMNTPETTGILNSEVLANVLIYLSTFLLLALTIFITRKKLKGADNIFDVEFSLFLLLIPLISTYTYSAHLSFLLIPFILVFFFLTKKERKWGDWLLILFVFSYVLIGLKYWLDGVQFFRSGIFVLFLSGKFYGVLLFWIICFYILLKERKVLNQKLNQVEQNPDNLIIK